MDENGKKKRKEKKGKEENKKPKKKAQMKKKKKERKKVLDIWVRIKKNDCLKLNKKMRRNGQGLEIDNKSRHQ